MAMPDRHLQDTEKNTNTPTATCDNQLVNKFTYEYLPHESLWMRILHKHVLVPSEHIDRGHLVPNMSACHTSFCFVKSAREFKTASAVPLPRWCFFLRKSLTLKLSQSSMGVYDCNPTWQMFRIQTLMLQVVTQCCNSLSTVAKICHLC